MTDRQPVGTLNKATLDKDGTDLAPADYEILPLNTLWPEIHPHCSDPEVQAQISCSTMRGKSIHWRSPCRRGEAWQVQHMYSFRPSLLPLNTIASLST